MIPLLSKYTKYVTQKRKVSNARMRNSPSLLNSGQKNGGGKAASLLTSESSGEAGSSGVKRKAVKSVQSLQEFVGCRKGSLPARSG